MVPITRTADLQRDVYVVFSRCLVHLLQQLHITRNVVTEEAQLVLSKVRHTVRELVERPYNVHQRLQQIGRQELHHVVSEQRWTWSKGGNGFVQGISCGLATRLLLLERSSAVDGVLVRDGDPLGVNGATHGLAPLGLGAPEIWTGQTRTLMA